MPSMAPVMFISHGAPTFALSENKASQLLRHSGEHFDRVKGVILLSPHWMTQNQEIAAGEAPETIHDYGGFHHELYQISYPAPGDPELALSVHDELTHKGIFSMLNIEQGRDHGAWVPMRHLLPQAEIPIVQLSLRHQSSWRDIVNLGYYLQDLRKKGIAIIGSGSLTHNLYNINWHAQSPSAETIEFQMMVRDSLRNKQYDKLTYDIKRLPSFAKVHPTDEHYLPLLFAIGALTKDDQLKVLEGGVEHGTLSMESYLWLA